MQEPAKTVLGHGLISTLKHTPCRPAGAAFHAHFPPRIIDEQVFRPISHELAVAFSYFPALPSTQQERNCPQSTAGSLLGVTLRSQASEMVEAVSELLLASGSALAVFTHSRIHESGWAGRLSLACKRYARCSNIVEYRHLVFHASVGLISQHRHFHASFCSLQFTYFRISAGSTSTQNGVLLCLRVSLLFHQAHHSTSPTCWL